MKSIYFILLLIVVACSSGDITTPDPSSFVAEWRVDRVFNGGIDITPEFEQYRIIFQSTGEYILFTKNSEGILVQREGSYEIQEEDNKIFLSNDSDLENYIIREETLTFSQIQPTSEGQKQLFFVLIKQ